MVSFPNSASAPMAVSYDRPCNAVHRHQ